MKQCLVKDDLVGVLAHVIASEHKAQTIVLESCSMGSTPFDTLAARLEFADILWAEMYDRFSFTRSNSAE